MLGLQFRTWRATEELKLDEQLTEYLLLFPPHRVLFECRSARDWFSPWPRDWLVLTSDSLILLKGSKNLTDISWPSINELRLSRRFLLLFTTRCLQVDYVESGRPKHATFVITRSDWHEVVRKGEDEVEPQMGRQIIRRTGVVDYAYFVLGLSLIFAAAFLLIFFIPGRGEEDVVHDLDMALTFAVLLTAIFAVKEWP